MFRFNLGDQMSVELQAQLARRIQSNFPADWVGFVQRWIAFNAIYGAEVGGDERSRVMRCIRLNFTEAAAQSVLDAASRHINKILDVPPGNMQRERDDPDFRLTSQRLADTYWSVSETAVGRLAAVGGVLYQVRCNLIHASKDPFDARDCMLITESLQVLQALIDALLGLLPGGV